MITFINSIIFAVSFIILIPILIHLFNRQKKRKKLFSSLHFLRLIEKQKLKRINLYQYILLLIRTLIILLLLLAFARPTMISSLDIVDTSASSTAVIILDSGISMQYYNNNGMRFNRAIQKIHQIKDLFKPEDKVFLIQSHHPAPLALDSVNLDNIKCGFISSNWQNVFIEASKIFREYPNFNREIFLITDNIVELKEIDALRQENNAQLYLFQIGDKSYDNISIDSVAYTTNLFEIYKPIELQVTLFNSGKTKAQSVEINLYANNKREAYQNISLAPNEKKSVQLSFQPKKLGFIEGFIEINDDPLLADNRYYFNIHIPKNIAVLFVEDVPSQYIHAAMKAIDSKSNIKVKFTDYNQWGRENINNFQKILMSDYTPTDANLQLRIKEYISSGGQLIILPGNNTTAVSLNSFLKTIQSRIRVISLRQILDDMQGTFQLHDFDFGMPLIKNVYRENFPEMSMPLFQKYFQFQAPASVSQLLMFSTGDPFLLSEDLQSGHLYIFSSYLDEKWSDLQYRGLFIPLLSRILSSTLYNMNQVVIGDQVYYHPDQNTDINTLYFNTPASQNIHLLPDNYSFVSKLQIPVFDLPGNYFILNDKDTIQIYSANPPANSNEQETKKSQILPQSSNFKIYYEDQVFYDSLIQSRSGFELWKIFLDCRARINYYRVYDY